MLGYSAGIMRPLHRLAVVIPLCLVSVKAHAQQEDQQLWTQINTSVPVAGRLRVTLEQIARFSDRQEGLFQSEFGALLSYRVAKGFDVGFGYRKVGAHNGKSGANEDRLRQQILFTAGHFVMRFRVDERFNPRGSETGFRVRPLVRYNHRVAKSGLALFASHESFFLPNTTDWGQRRGYERMRNIVGFVLPLGPQMNADIGYLNQYRFARGGAPAQSDHALNLQLTINLTGRPIFPTHD